MFESGLKRTLHTLTTAVLAASMLMAGTTQSSAEDIKISFVVKDMTNPYYWRMGEGAKQAAADLGVELSWVSAEFNGDIEGQIAVVEGELVKQPDALVLVPMNAKALIPKIREANRLGIPVVTADTRAEEGLADVVTFVGLDERLSYKGMAEFVVEHLGGSGKVAILEGFRGSSTAEERLVGMHEVLDAAPGIEVVASISADWDREKGLKATEDILQAHPDVDAILASNDEMALGAVQAVNSAGKKGEVIVVGDDAIPAALEALKSGDMLATIDGNTDKVGYQAVKTAYEFVTKGMQPDAWVVVPSNIMLKDDVTDEYLKARGIQ
ncbi:MAG: sugar ABC transporter substrate-binding protein [Immundisolibacterales bacterium]|nr:sugar ABC transporter substrate-binding protein [Immundisolibacterales bacterium]